MLLSTLAPAAAAATVTSPVPDPAVATPVAENTGPASLLMPKAMAGRYVRNLIDKGVAIRRLRVRYVEDLDEVRGKKTEWVTQYTDVLRQLFSNGAVADACNDWVGRVYPEYADTTLFVEQFYQEMDHRVRRLRAVLKKIGEMSDPAITVKADAAAGDATGGGTTSADGTTQAATGGATSGDVAGGTPAAASCAFPPVATAEPLSAPVPLAGILAAAAGDMARAGAAVGKFLEDLGVSLIQIPAGGGAASLEAYEQAPETSFALLVLSPEEACALRPPTGDAAPGTCRADVAFQLGYFVGRLGAKRVFVVSPGATEGFTEAHGVACLPLDTAQG